MANSQVSYDHFYVDVTDPALTHIWVFCRSDFQPAHGWRHKVIPASEPFIEWLAKPGNFEPLNWDRGSPNILIGR